MKVYTVKVGERYGKLTVISEIYIKRFGKRQSAFRVVDCRCECGGTCTPAVNLLATGRSKACRCAKREATIRRNFKHGCSLRGKRDPLHGVWSSIKTRCYNQNAKSYRDYGARGVGMCEAWRESFTAFQDWAVASGYVPRKLTIDRRDSAGNYEPENCRWITRQEQNRNRRVHRMVTAFGETKCAADWGDDERCVVRTRTLRERLREGWEPERAITLPKRLNA